MKTTTEEPFKSILVALDLTEMDDYLIQYTHMLSKLLPVERIFFVHVAKDLELPADLLKEFPGLLEPMDESIIADIQKKVDHYFDSSTLDVNCIVKEGNAIDKVLKLCKVKNIDLILMGRKKSLQGSGIVSSKIARKCPCSLLLVTQDFKAKLNKILVPVDFSDHAALAMQRALDLSSAPSMELLMTHVYRVPIGYYKTGKSREEFEKIMQAHAEKDCRKFLTKHSFPPDTPCEYVATDDGKHAELTHAFAEAADVDLIVIGSRGRTAASAILMGSVAEKLVYRDSNIPILIVKSNGENMGVLQTLMKI
ncbi:universal stress protein [Tunicatimonas pelagia]|uniref:universal stress protein n=1 Tax=Tunicatimonas pelagia TaxID=931531 RepID=UPI002664FCEA|nr:universal stress protein [Tunicatimonas pelagia]WKN45594.1 universal stress protein [Tunicatimonas pelagia]